MRPTANFDQILLSDFLVCVRVCVCRTVNNQILVFVTDQD